VPECVGRKAGRRKGRACAGERMKDEGWAEGEGRIQESGARSQETGVGAREHFCPDRNLFWVTPATAFGRDISIVDISWCGLVGEGTKDICQ